MAAVGALQAVCGLNPTGTYDSATAEALQRLAEQKRSAKTLGDDRKLLGDVIGTAIYPSDLYQRMSDATKTAEEVEKTNGSVLEIAGTDIDGGGGEQRFRIWKNGDEGGVVAAAQAKCVFDAVCFVYTCRRLIDLSQMLFALYLHAGD